MREYRTVTMDAHRWDDFVPRDGDIIVATYPKCGTTWTQRIVDLLLNQSPAPRQFTAAAPWLDATFFAPVEADLATLEAQTQRRSMKSHLPLDSLPVYAGAKVIHVARDGRDACWSMHNHMLGFRPELVAAISAQNAGDAQLGGRAPGATPEDPHAYFERWMEDAEVPAPKGLGFEVPFCEFERTYWAARHEPWMLMVHYADLKADLEGEMGRISEFLGIATPPALMSQLAHAATFETMKAQGEEMLPMLSFAFDRGADRFLNKGVNGRWKDVLTAADLERYDALIRRKLTPAHAAWIERGRLAAGDPRKLPD